MKRKTIFPWRNKVAQIIIDNLKIMNIIRPGVYRPKNNLKDSEISGLLTVIGENDHKDDYFDCRNRVNPISEEDLVANYVYFGPGIEPTEKDKIKYKKMVNNLGDFDKINVPELTKNDNDFGTQEVEKINTQQQNTQQKNVSYNLAISSSKHNTNDNIEDNIENNIVNKILSKSKINNKISQTITITTNFNIDKVIDLCDTFDIPFTSIANKVIDFNNIKFNDDKHDVVVVNEVNDNSNVDVDTININDKLDTIILMLESNNNESLSNNNEIESLSNNNEIEILNLTKEISNIRKSINN